MGGDPANYGNDVGALEEAYRVRQSEFSRVRAEIAHNQPAPEPAKTFQELLNEEFAKYDPTKFTNQVEMWEAQTEKQLQLQPQSSKNKTNSQRQTKSLQRKWTNRLKA